MLPYFVCFEKLLVPTRNRKMVWRQEWFRFWGYVHMVLSALMVMHIHTYEYEYIYLYVCVYLAVYTVRMYLRMPQSCGIATP